MYSSEIELAIKLGRTKYFILTQPKTSGMEVWMKDLQQLDLDLTQDPINNNALSHIGRACIEHRGDKSFRIFVNETLERLKVEEDPFFNFFHWRELYSFFLGILYLYPPASYPYELAGLVSQVAGKSISLENLAGWCLVRLVKNEQSYQEKLLAKKESN